MTRKTIAHLFHSLDDVVESPNLWQFGLFGAEEGAAMGASIAPVTDVVIGRVLWEEWSQYWPTATDPFGDFINGVRKHVISSTLSGELGWNSTLIEGDPVDYVRQLRETGEGDISVVGGIETVRSMFLAGVVDQLMLTTHPVVAGEGRRLFDGVGLTRLELVAAEVTTAGNVMASYALKTDS